MKERPILFNTAMVQAILAGRKTQTRRLLKPCKDANFNCELALHEIAGEINAGDFSNGKVGKPGDRLWVRETWCDVHPLQAAGRFSKEGRAGIPAMKDESYRTIYRADGEYPPIWNCDNYPYRTLDKSQSTFPDWDEPKGVEYGWWPSIHMPRWACRIILEITVLRVERLNNISNEDCKAEGYPESRENDGVTMDPFLWFRDIWNSTGGNWAANPWVWVIEFKVLTINGVVPEAAA